MQKWHLNSGLSRSTNTLANRQSPDHLSLSLRHFHPGGRARCPETAEAPEVANNQGTQFHFYFLWNSEGNHDITPGDTVFSPDP